MKKLFVACLLPLSAFAQDVKVFGNSSQNDVLKSLNTSTASSDRNAVYAVSKPAANWGVGVRAEGGYIGVITSATLGGVGSRTALSAEAGNGASYNYGVSSIAYADNASLKYGGYMIASGSGGTKYGVYGSAMGSGTNYGVYCNGNGAYTGSWTKISDARTKKNIQDYSGALGKVMALSVKRYEFKRDEYSSMNLKSTPEVGVLAQDVEKVLPELVQDVVAPLPTDGSKKDATAETVTLKGVDYIAIVPILLQAMKEQQAQIDALKKKIGG